MNTSLPVNDHDLLSTEHQLVQASKGKRFANYLIDGIAFYVAIILLGLVIGLIAPELVDSLDNTDPVSSIIERLVGFVLYGLFMSGMEAVLKGKSIGKYITGTKAVYEDGSTISAATAFKRGFSRAVPFEAFSALGSPSYPWHDKWSDTIVIDEKESVFVFVD